MSIAATNKARLRFVEGLSPLCPSCGTEEETCAHVLLCAEVGRVTALSDSITALDTWMEESYTDPRLRQVIVQYANSRGSAFMSDFCYGMGPDMWRLGRIQDGIGWRRFMEGMLPLAFRTIQRDFWYSCGWRGNPSKWMETLMLKLLECSHGQWLYRNIMVHDRWTGQINRQRKEQILREIEEQLENGDELLPEDNYLLEINIGDMDNSPGDRQEYWLRAIQTARMAKQLASGIG
jgi:hypothetical protein